MENTQSNVAKLAKMAMLVAISIIFVMLPFPFKFSPIPSVPFLEYDMADIPILIGTFAYGPVAGIIITVIASVIQGVTVSSASGAYGIIMHIIATSVFSLVAGVVYNIRHKKTKVHAIAGLAFGSLAMVIVMIFANLLITPFFMGTTVQVVWGLMPGIIAFNVIKVVINSVITFLLYKRISPFLHGTPSKKKKAAQEETPEKDA